MNTKLLVLFLICCPFFCLQAQSPYSVNFKQDIPLIMGGLLGNYLSKKYTDSQIEVLSEMEVLALDKNDINRFDRSAVNNTSKLDKNASDVLLISSFAYPFALYLGKPIRKDIAIIYTMTSEALLINGAITQIVKATASRARPFVYNPDIPYEEKSSTGDYLSFFSGHTSQVSVASFFTAKVFSDYYPDSKWKPVIWTTAAILPAATGYFRYKAGKHFPTDVITGYVVGGLIGYFIPHLHKKKVKDKGLSLTTSGSLVGLKLQW